jgi:hypothetical protein
LNFSDRTGTRDIAPLAPPLAPNGSHAIAAALYRRSNLLRHRPAPGSVNGVGSVSLIALESRKLVDDPQAEMEVRKIDPPFDDVKEKPRAREAGRGQSF